MTHICVAGSARINGEFSATNLSVVLQIEYFTLKTEFLTHYIPSTMWQGDPSAFDVLQSGPPIIKKMNETVHIILNY
jgi:hypothetical protein